MRRVAVVFLLLTAGLAVGLYIKIRQDREVQSRASGSSGTVEGTEVNLTARISSRIVAINAREGDTVHRGQVLVELDCRENKALLAAAEARLHAAQSTAAAARAQMGAALGSAQAAAANVHASGAQSQALMTKQEASARQQKRVARLQGEGGATVSDLDQVSTQVRQLGDQIAALRAQQSAARGQASAARASAEAARQQAEAALASVTASQAEAERARTLVDECQLVAPIDGVVQTRALEPGEAVLPGTRVLNVVRLDEVQVTFYLPNRELAAAGPGKTVTAVADAYPSQRFSGKIDWVSAEAEFTSRNVQTREDRDRLVYAVRVKLPNPERQLRPGMPVEISIDGTGSRP
jgi:HlyD family secretion protein